MLTLTTPITCPNITKARVRRLETDEDNAEVRVMVELTGPSNRFYGNVDLAVRNGMSDRVRANPAPLRFDDLVLVDRLAVSTATGYTDLSTLSGANPSARNRAAETALVSAGVLPAGTVS